MKRILNGLFGYVLSIGLAVIFALYLSGRVGWFLVLAFVLAPVLSAFLAWCVSKRIRIMADPDSDIVSKGDSCRLHIEIENRWIFPSPSIAIAIHDSVCVKSHNKHYLVSVMPFSREEFDVEYTARICGSTWIGLENVVVKDYFDLFSFKLKDAKEQHFQWNVGVIPEIAEISERDERLSKIVSASIHADNSEDTVETVTTSLMGFPGYENREYIPGDPLKRVNWKLSAKKDQLLVRLDDEAPGLSINVVLDSVFANVHISQEMLPADLRKLAPEEQLPMVAQAAIEDSLGLARVLMKRNYTVVYYMHGKRRWEQYRLMHESDLAELRKALAYFGFINGNAYSNSSIKGRVPYDEILTEKETLTLICTPCADMGLEQEVKAKAGGRSSEILIYPVVSKEW